MKNNYNVANLNLPFSFTGQGSVNLSIDGKNTLYLTSYGEILHDQYRQVIPNTKYTIKGFFIYQ